jgi:hypothetical protein
MHDKHYVIVRSRDAGVFAGYIIAKNKSEVVLTNAIRIWYWSGAATLSQLAMEGVKDPKNCKFGIPLDKIIILGVCEIISTTEEATANIQSVEPWKM